MTVSAGLFAVIAVVGFVVGGEAVAGRSIVAVDMVYPFLNLSTLNLVSDASFAL